MKDSDGLTRAKDPKPVLTISSRTVFASLSFIVVVILISINMSKHAPREKAPEKDDRKALPSFSVTMLPSSYGEIQRIAPTPLPSLPFSDGEISRDVGSEKVLAERLERATLARKAKVSFETGSIGKESGKDTLILKDEKTSDGELKESSRDETNRQDDKRAFLDQKRLNAVQLSERVSPLPSKYSLMAGTIIPGLLLTGINSDLPGKILGQVSQDIFDTVNGNYLLIPQGTKVLGEYDSRIVYGQERALIVWTRLLFPNGDSISLENMSGVDLSGYAGLSDQVNNHYLRLLSGVLFSSILSASAQVASGRNFATVDPNYEDLALQGVAKNTNDVGQEITRRNLNVQPTIEIRPGYRFNVFVHKDVILKPYQG